MPEGPEVRREADQIGAVLAEREIEECFFGLERLAHHAPTFQGVSVVEVTSRGKGMLIRFDNGLTLFTHNQLYGKWMVRKRGQMPATGRSLRVALHTKTHSALLYSASTIEVLDEVGLAEQPFLSKLGPDVLDKDLHWRDVLTRLQDPKFRRRSVAALYLDQHFLAGLGNYLRSEIVHVARVSPFVAPRELGRGQLGELARATLLLSQRAYATAGVTNAPSRVKRLKSAGLKRREFRFAVFDRQHQPCYTCGAEIQRVEISARRLYYCPICQA